MSKEKTKRKSKWLPDNVNVYLWRNGKSVVIETEPAPRTRYFKDEAAYQRWLARREKKA